MNRSTTIPDPFSARAELSVGDRTLQTTTGSIAAAWPTLARRR